ncbi:MAG: isoleucine--tRNA ligase [Saprospiraceae bacterium]|nr:isoleucine--tRNA ligase [Saprospiraceae bacterium]
MYRAFKSLNLPEIDQEILAFWEKENVFQKSVDQRDSNNTFVFYEGPPSANGMPGIHHVMARAVKDIFCRFQTMNGKKVERKGGWDTHGLPIELSVEKELGITKDDIGKKISVDEYNDKCRETVLRYKDKWDELTKNMGYWVDLEHPYITYENNYIESVWWLLSKLYNKHLLYKGYTIQPYSPAAGTGLSSHELNQPGCYRELRDTSIVAKFEVIRNSQSEFLYDENQEDLRMLAWTTTPWTLPGNCALTVGANIDYVKVKTFSPYTYLPVSVILAKALVGKYFSEKGKDVAFDSYKAGDKVIPWQIVQEMKGKDLLDIRYKQLMPAVQNELLAKDAFRVIAGDFVTIEDGTGIVHTASVFGADDFRVCQLNNIPSVLVKDENGNDVPTVDKKGKFVSEVGEFLVKKISDHHIKTHKIFGKDDFYVKNYLDEDEKQPDYKTVDEIISIILKSENKAFKVEKYLHNYPHCWRTDKPILYYPLDSWFIKAASMKERMSALNKTINWKPESTGTGRFGNWLDNLQDWNLSRSRYWGIPIPIWRTEDTKEAICIGSLAELQSEIDKANSKLGLNQVIPQDIHRPYIDNIILVSSDGQPMKRELDLIDVWFDSGAMPFAQWHFPFENIKQFARNYPADFIAEGVDQTRGWFYTLHAISSMVKEDIHEELKKHGISVSDQRYPGVAFKNVVSNGLVLDKNGQKMSKRLGNAVDPFETLPTYGADATRWYMISNSQPWDNLKFDVNGITETRNKLFGTLFNTYNFFAIYANVDGFEMDEQNVSLYKNRTELDRWILSKLYSLVKQVKECYEQYEPTNAARLIENYVDEHLSNWYVRLSRRRFWKGEMSEDKKMAYETLFECLNVVAQMMAPIAPFFTDWLYKNLTDNIREKAIANNTPLQYSSIHLTYLTPVSENLIDVDLEQRMDYAQRISSLVLSLRKKEKIRVRQPLHRILLPVLNEDFKSKVEEVKDLVLAETNVKELEYVLDTSGLITKKAKANFKTLGRSMGKHMKDAAAIIENMTQAEIANAEKNQQFQIEISGEKFDLNLEDLIITSEDIPGWQVASDGALTVALDTTIDEKLAAEGTARELINRIQNIRKSSDFNIVDRISITLEDHPIIRNAVDQFGTYICNETLADNITLSTNVDAELVEIYEDLIIPIKVVLKK